MAVAQSVNYMFPPLEGSINCLLWPNYPYLCAVQLHQPFIEENGIPTEN